MHVSRRRFLSAGSITTVGALAGCLGGNSTGPDEPLSTPVKGAAEAPVTVESFEDFTCKFCRQFALEILPQIEANYIEPGTVRFIRHDFPFLDEEWSWKTAYAARAVQDMQGQEVFYEYVDLLYQNFDSYSIELFGNLAESVGADPETVRTAVADERYLQTLEAEKSLGEETDVTKTPTVLVDGERPESPRYEDVAAAIDAKIQ
ncbi:DsbA family protein [Halodesulfurarchaeum sp.]|uniref:DsbA family protein n=1 Tax=Halodesulfurarchaeum sp. TaxID=1980530 RepID=UPI002FC343BB